VGTASVLTRVAMLESTEMTAGQSQMVQLRLAEPLPLAPGDRFVLRANLAAEGQSGLVTIAAGVSSESATPGCAARRRGL